MTYEQAFDALVEFVRTAKATPQAQQLAKDALAAISDEVDLMRRRYADKEAVRLGHILRHACTPEQHYTAEHAARAEHPEAWEGRIPAVWTGEGVR